MATERFKIHPAVTAILALTVVFSLVQRFRGSTDTATTTFSTPVREPKELEAVPGKSSWQRSEVFAEETAEEQMNTIRARFSERFDPKEYHVFWGNDPLDDAKPPKGWLEEQKKTTAHLALPPRVTVSYAYQPYRVYVVPRTEVGDAIRRFRVGTHYEPKQEMVESVVKKVEAIDALVPSQILHMGDSHLRLAFQEKTDEAACKELQKLFPFEQEGDMDLGLEGYFSDWTPESGPDFLAKAFQRDQGIHLWWD